MSADEFEVGSRVALLIYDSGHLAGTEGTVVENDGEQILVLWDGRNQHKWLGYTLNAGWFHYSKWLKPLEKSDPNLWDELELM